MHSLCFIFTGMFFLKSRISSMLTFGKTYWEIAHKTNIDLCQNFFRNCIHELYASCCNFTGRVLTSKSLLSWGVPAQMPFFFFLKPHKTCNISVWWRISSQYFFYKLSPFDHLDMIYPTPWPKQCMHWFKSLHTLQRSKDIDNTHWAFVPLDYQ